jgi:hypothetical protein
VQIKQVIRKIWEEKPLALILFAGIFFRLLAVIFSKGFGMHDDHFLVVEPSASAVDGFTHWKDFGSDTPYSIFYPGLHYFFFMYLKWRGLTDPQTKMYIMRTVNATWSLITIIYGYKIAELVGGKKVGRQAGLILSILWFFPMLSVRDLVEMACIPPIMVATYLLIHPEKNQKLKNYAWAGILCGLTFNMRFQALIFVGILGLILLLQKKWKGFFVYSLLLLIMIVSIQGIVDTVIWGKPFTEFREYIAYNIHNANTYTHGPWYQYLLLIGGVLIPPVGLFILFGYFKSWKKYPLLFWPAFGFLLFHSIFPNKQERFILPIVPFIIILGLIGWNEFSETSKFWQKRKKLMNACWAFFWILNIIALPVISTMYSKRSRVESMTWLSKQKDLHGILVEESTNYSYTQLPVFYLNRWNILIRGITKTDPAIKVYKSYSDVKDTVRRPNYIIFFGAEQMEQRLDSFKKIFPLTEFRCEVEPGFMDNLLYWLNPVNKNQSAFIYKFSEKIVNLPDSSVKK